MISHYLVCVVDDDLEKYLFSRHVLVVDSALAKCFSGISIARRYFNRSSFSKQRYSIIVVHCIPPPPIRHNLGSIVE